MRVLRLVALASVLFMLVGCTGTTVATSDQNTFDPYANAPEWVNNPEIAGGLAAVGSSNVGKAGRGFARNAAMADGRNELARQCDVKVKNMIKDFAQSTGIGDSETVEKVTTQVSKQVANQSLSASRMKSSWYCPSTKELFVLMVLDPQQAKTMVKEAAQSSYQNKEALWQQFQAQKAQEELDAEIDKMIAPAGQEAS